MAGSSLEDDEGRVKQETTTRHADVLGCIQHLIDCYLQGISSVGDFEVAEDKEKGRAWLHLVTKSLHSLR